MPRDVLNYIRQMRTTAWYGGVDVGLRRERCRWLFRRWGVTGRGMCTAALWSAGFYGIAIRQHVDPGREAVQWTVSACAG